MLRLDNSYYVKMNLSDFYLLSHINAKEILIKEEYVYFYIKKSDICLLQKINFEIIENYTFSALIKTNIIFILGLFIIFIMTFLTSITVTEIITYDTFYIDEYNNTDNVIIYIEKNIKNIGPFKVLDKSIYDINRMLKVDFSDINWVNIKKIGTKIYLETISENYTILNDDSRNSHLISCKDCYITNVLVFSGKLECQIGQSVSKNDVLVSNIVNENEIKTKAIIVGKYHEYEKIHISKSYFDVIKSGRIKTKNIFTIFKKVINKMPNHYQNYVNEYINLVKIGGIFSLIKVVQYEVLTVEFSVNRNFAIVLSEDKLINEFDCQTIYDRILDYKFIDLEETDTEFIITYLVSYQKNVAIYDN